MYEITEQEINEYNVLECTNCVQLSEPEYETDDDK